MKVTSKLIGPEGIALLGQYNNTISIISLLAGGAIGTGIVKYVAEFKEDKPMLDKYLSNAFGITFICSLVFSVFVIFSYKWLGFKSFKSHEYDSIFLLYGLFLSINTFNGVFTSILNGLSEIKRMTYVNITNALLNLCITITAAYFLGIYGCLLAGIVVGSVNLIIVSFSVRKFGWFNWKTFSNGLDWNIVKGYFQFTIMAMLGVISPFTLLMIRNYLISHLGVENAGFWQAMTRLSDTYLSLITGVLSVYYLPKLTSIKGDVLALRSEVRVGFLRILPPLILSSFLIYLLRFQIVQFLFSEKFVEVNNLVAFAMIGCVFKVSCFLLGYILYAKQMTKHIIVLALLYEVMQYTTAVIFVNKFGLIGTSYAFALTFFTFTGIYTLIFRKLLFAK